MIVFCLFVILLIVLFFLSSRLKATIHQLLFSLTKSKSWSISLFSLLFFPGTVIHELSHFLIASLLLVPVSNLELVPKIADNGKIRLGSVQIAKVDFLRRTIIGIAPLFAGLAVLWFITNNFLLESRLTQLFAVYRLPFTFSSLNYSITPLLDIFLPLYLIFTISATMFASHKDMDAAKVVVPVLAILGVSAYIAGFRFEAVQQVLTQTSSIVGVVNNTLIVALLLQAGLWLLLRLVLTFSFF